MLAESVDAIAISLAKRAVRRPEHPWIDLYLGDQILRATEIAELDTDKYGEWSIRRRYPEDTGQKSVLVPFYALPGEDPSLEIEEQRSFGNSFDVITSLVGLGQSVVLPRKVGLDCAYTAFARAYLGNGMQSGGPDAVIGLNAAAALTWIGVLLPRAGLFKCASQVLLEQLDAAGIGPGSVPELQHVTALATSGILSPATKAERIASTSVVVADDTRADETPVGKYLLGEAKRLQDEAGEEPRVWESGSRALRSARAELELHPWWSFCSPKAQQEIANAIAAKRFGLSPATWGRGFGVALEEMSRRAVEPLRELAMLRGQRTIDLAGKHYDVSAVRWKFGLGDMEVVLARWIDAKLRDELVLAFLSGRLTTDSRARLWRLVSQAAALRNKAAHSDSFDEPSALELEQISFDLFPLLVKLAAD